MFLLSRRRLLVAIAMTKNERRQFASDRISQQHAASIRPDSGDRQVEYSLQQGFLSLGRANQFFGHLV